MRKIKNVNSQKKVAVTIQSLNDSLDAYNEKNKISQQLALVRVVLIRTVHTLIDFNVTDFVTEEKC